MYIKYMDSVINMYKRNRPHYLARIDTAALKKMTGLYVHDQLEKNPYKTYNASAPADGHDYERTLEQSMADLKQLIKDKGWPSDKLIGIGQKDIMSELKVQAPDFQDYYGIYKDDNFYAITKDQFDIQEYEFSNCEWTDPRAISSQYQRVWSARYGGGRER